MTNKILFEKARKDAKRFCRRNNIYNTYDESVANMIEKLYVTTYLRAFHQQSTEVKKNVIQWHKVADGDLPEKEKYFWSRTVLIQTNKGSSIIGFYDYASLLWYNKVTVDIIYDEVIAWCEIPKMEESE